MICYPGLFLAGEILDCNGRICAFNFQWAWSTGHIAGTAAGPKPGRAPPRFAGTLTSPRSLTTTRGNLDNSC